MSLNRFHRYFGLFLIFAAVFAAGACRSQTGGTPEGLVIINAPVTGKVRRVLVSEGANVQEKTSLIEITVVSNVTRPAGDENRQVPPARNTQGEIRVAEEDLQQASVELQRIEPLVASGNAPQAHLDAARAQYQQAQERLDQLRRQAQSLPPNLTTRQENASQQTSDAAKENIVAVPAPVAGNVRVISVRIGQSVKAGEPVATISTTR
ncbi:MAG TPA: hypothetical protein VF604_06970 [Pyrinomonadaceae bacterium]